MKYVFFTLFIMSATGLQAQDTLSSRTPGFRRFQLGIGFSPDMNYRTLVNNGGSSATDLLIENHNDREVPRFGFTAGISACYNFKSWIGLELGVQYSNKGYQTRRMALQPLPPEPGLPEAIRTIYNFHYIDLPLKVNFTVGRKNVRFIAAAGIATNIFIDETQTTISDYTDGRTETETGPTPFTYNPVNLSALVSAGIDWEICHRMNLRIEPTFRYGILKINDTPIAAYLWNAGISTSIRFGW